ncbi:MULTISPECIES: hypothetical protein [Clostridium]|jgi:hypothetical protein|uniref:Uncharacterized protein n=1 Tax=Clostridium lapidicellarium TaxID=3240931 RepID=A0ABV4DSS7_9CLOT|nr:hypothetical protein [uncultured Clostridium sp.]
MYNKVFLEVDDRGMVYREMPGKNFALGLFDAGEINKNITSVNEIKVNLRNKKLVVLVHGEEVYVMSMTLPKVGRKNIYRIIEEEIENKFKKMNDIMFSYRIIRHFRHSLEIMVFCMNYDSRKLIEECHSAGFCVKGIVPVQFYIWETYRNKIKSESYIFILMRNGILYFMVCHENKMVLNNVFENMKKSDFFYILRQFQMKLNVLLNNFRFQRIFFVDFPYTDIIEKLSDTYFCEDLSDGVKKDMKKEALKYSDKR